MVSGSEVRAEGAGLGGISGLRLVKGGVDIDVLVVASSSRSRVVGMHGDRLKVQVGAPPAKGAANTAVVETLAEFFGVSRGMVSLVSGASRRQKRFHIEGPTLSEVADRLQSHVEIAKGR